MQKKNYEKTLFRLVAILNKLSNSEKYNSQEFADEFCVTIRTIQNDMKRLGVYYPISKDADGKFIFEYGFTFKKTMLTQDELIVLNLALSQFDEVEDIHKIKESIFKKVITQPFYSPYYIKQDDFEDIDMDAPIVQIIENSIKNKELVELRVEEVSLHVETYKITAYDGIWYLFARTIEDKKIKIFRLKKIKKITPLGKYHRTDLEKMDKLLEKTHSPFFQDGTSYEVVIKVDALVSHYFEAKEFLESQKIIKKHKDGSLEVSFEISHDEDIDNMIKSWLPHVEILKPLRYREKVTNELKEYIKRVEAK